MLIFKWSPRSSFPSLRTSYVNYSSLRIKIERDRADELDLLENGIVSMLITALSSNAMIAPSVWIDRKTGNNYFLAMPYPDKQITKLDDLKATPLHCANLKQPTPRRKASASPWPVHSSAWSPAFTVSPSA
jgi:hypothetical protein